MIQIRETAGDTLQGAIDGANRSYLVSYDYALGSVAIYVNGRLKMADWDDGFIEVPPRQVILNEPLLAGDSLEVEYRSPVKSGGGADGGIPYPPQAVPLTPAMTGHEPLPAASAMDVDPGLASFGAAELGLSSENVHPDLFVSKDE
jgi:hypothetical protein